MDATSATGANPQVVIPPNIKIRDYYGVSKDDKGYSVVAFIADIEKAAELNGWSGRQTAAFASTCLKGAAATYIHRLQLDPQSGTETEDWTTLKATLKKRFEEKITANTTYNTTQTLTKMGEGESFETFADRITIAKRLLDKDLSDALRSSDEYGAIFERETINVFLCGIPEDIKTFILDHHPKAKLFEMAKAAQEHVNHKKEKKAGRIVQGLQVNDINHQMSDEFREHVRGRSGQSNGHLEGIQPI